MAYEPKDGSGSLFKNDKGDNDKRPDYRGDIMLDGKLWELAAWIKEGNKGKFMSLSGKPKEAKENANQSRSADASKPAPASSGAGRDFDDSDIPFAPFERRSAV